MFDVYFCIRDQHDWRLVVLAGLICGLCALVAVFLLRQVRGATRRKHRIGWLATAGLATGFGIWATHFVAMLGYNTQMVLGYAPALTLFSLLIAACMTTIGFALATQWPTRGAQWLGGFVVVEGIAAMHYTGMLAVEVPGHIEWSLPYVLASVLLALPLAASSVTVALRGTTVGSAARAATLLMLSILVLHFVGMTAATVVPNAGDERSGGLLSPMNLGIAIGAVALVVLVLCSAAALLSNRARDAILASEREFRILVQGITDCAIYMLDPQGRVASWNAGAQRLKGYTADEAIGMPLARFYSDAEVASQLPERALSQAFQHGKYVAEGWRHRRDGSRFWAHVTMERVADADGEFHGYAKITRDMSRFKHDQDRLATMAGNLDAALSNMHQGLCLFDASERLVLSNASVGHIFGLAREQYPVGTKFRDLLRLALETRAGGAISDVALHEAYERHRACILRPGGDSLVVDFTDDCTLAIAHRPMPDGGWVSTFEDITDRRRSEARIAHMALHDDLTGLANRAHFNRTLDPLFERAMRDGGRIAVVAIDLDRFKEINDTRGHAAGDAVLCALAERLTASLQPGEFVARFGGDEFAAYAPFRDVAELTGFVGRLETALNGSIEIDGAMLRIAASLGVACCPADGCTREQVLSNADLAMFRAKDTVARQVCYYEAGMDEIARARRGLATDLRDAIDRGEFSLAYQVQRSLSTNLITGYEALLRWKHPREGWIPPSHFIPIAEESGEILRIGEWVLRAACAAAREWDPPSKVAVNLSPIQLMDPDLVGMVTRVLEDTGLSPRQLELEITETAIVTDKQRALHALRQIKMLGITVAIDDFGTGYSSLDTLNSFPFDKIKIDRSFLIESENSPQARAIIRAVLALGRSLHVPVLAEGLESAEQLSLLRAEGCDEAQGFYFGRPQFLPPTSGGPGESFAMAS